MKKLKSRIKLFSFLIIVFAFYSAAFIKGQRKAAQPKQKITNYKMHKTENPEWEKFRLKQFDSLTPSKYYRYKYDKIQIAVRVFPNVISAQNAFRQVYKYFKTRPGFEHLKYGILFSKAGAYYITKSKVIYCLEKECKHPESYYEPYEKQFQTELYGKAVPDSAIINLGCGGRNFTR